MVSDEVRKQYEKAKEIRLYCIFGMSTVPLIQYLLLFKFVNKFFNILLSIGTFLLILRIYNKKWRCPVCNKRLPDRDVNKIDYCPKCGVKLVD